MIKEPAQRTNYRQSSSLLQSLSTLALLVVILILGAYLRFVGLDWDEGQHLHPDERFLSQVENGISPVDSLQAYFDTNASTLNPNNVGFGFFVYGDLPIIVARYIGEWVGTTSYYDIYKTGRAFSAISDLITIVLIFLAARRLFDHRVGLLAAALYADAALPIQQSHFFTVDIFTNLFVAASFYLIARLYTQHRWVDYILFGLALGMGMASKVSIYPLAMILIAALGLRLRREIRREIKATEQIDSPEGTNGTQQARSRLIRRAAAGLIVAGLVTVLAFRVGQPYAFLPPNSDVPIEPEQLGPTITLISKIGDPVGMRPNPAWLAQMSEVRRMVSGQADIPPNHQWGKRLPLVFPWVNMVRLGLGWPLGLFAWLAVAWALWEIARGHQNAWRLIPPVLWTAAFFTWQGIAWVTTMRYFLPVYPTLLIIAAWAMVTLVDRVRALIRQREASPRHWSMVFSSGLTALILVTTFAWGFAVSRIYTRPVTRVAASRWILENIPSDVTFFVETDDGVQPYQLGLPNNWLDPAQLPQITLESEESGSPEEDPTRPVVYYTLLSPELPQPYQFTLPYSGKLTHLRLNHVADQEGREGTETLRVLLAEDINGTHVLAEGQIVDEFSTNEHPRGSGYTLMFAPVDVSEGQPYYLILQADPAGPLVMSGSTITTEGDWDDPIPLSLAPYNVWGSQYQGYEMQMAWEDVDTKRERMKYVLEQTDYLTISSNRFYDSMSRNPQRYPLTIAYYHSLFSGELGFELIADFTSRPNLGPISFNDDTGEEAWTVYDHPRVFVFKKTEAYSPEAAAAILDAVDLDNAVRVIAKDSKGRPVRIDRPRLNSGFLNTEETFLLTTGSPADLHTSFYIHVQPLAVILWWLLILIIGWAAFPILFVLFPGLPDRGYPVSKVFGLLVTSWLAWMAASLKLIRWSGGSILLALLITGSVSVILALRQRESLMGWLRENTRHVVVIEIVTALLFLGFLLVRLGNPDLWHPAYGGEKPMDLSYFNAVLKSGFFPPYDPWFADGTINYYYFGFVIVAVPVKLLNMPVTLAYNLILPMLFSMTGIGAFSAAYNLAGGAAQGDTEGSQTGSTHDSKALREALRAWPRVSPYELVSAFGQRISALFSQEASKTAYLAGFAALVMTVILGNLDQIRTIIWGLAELGSGTPAYTSTLLPRLGDVFRGLKMSLGQGSLLPIGLGEWYWNATRLIPVPISESGIPLENGPITEFPFFTFLYADLHAHMIAMPISLLAVVWGIGQLFNMTVKQKRLVVLLGANLAAGALIIGALRPTNTWDFPAYLLLGIGALALAHASRRADSGALKALGIGSIGAAILAAGTYFLAGNSLILAAVGGAAGLLLGGVLAFITGPGQSGDTTESPAEPASQNGDMLRSWMTLASIGLQAAVLVGGTMLLYRPYLRNYELGYNTIIPWTGSTTPIWAYLDIHGLFLFIIVSWLVKESYDWIKAARQSGRGLSRGSIVPAIILIAAITAVIYGIAASGLPAAALGLPLIVWAAALLTRPEITIPKRAALVAFSLAITLSLVVEVVVLQGDISRMNTVFKFYLQVWIILALVAGAALAWLRPALRRAPLAVNILWSSGLIILIFLAGLYPLLATRAKVSDRWSTAAPHTLDGMAYMSYVERYENGEVFSLKPDYQAIRWLQDNGEGTPVILEAHTIEYFWGNRVTAYTGLPSLIGWNWHQRQQRPNNTDEVWARVVITQDLYTSTDIQYTLDMLERYNISLIYVGDLERAYYPSNGLAKFERMVDLGYLDKIYDYDNTRIYRVKQEARQN